MTRYMRWLEAERGRSFGDYQALWEWSVSRAGGVLGLDLGLLRGRRVGAVLRGPARARDARRQVVWRRRAELRPAHLPRQARHGRRRAARVRAAPARRAALGGAAGAGRSRGRRASRPGGRARGSRRRLHAERARNAGRLPGDRVARCDLVELLAGLRRLERRRPLRADRAEGDVLRRRLPLQRQGLRSHRDASPGCSGRCRRSSTPSSSPTSTPRPTSRAWTAPSPGPSCWPRARARSFDSSRFRSTIRSGSCTRRGPPACRRRSSRATAGSCSST